MKKIVAAVAMCLLVVSGSGLVCYALEDTARQEFERIMDLRLSELAKETDARLQAKYPDENWEQWRFPAYVTDDYVTEISYRVAVKEPRLLGVANVSDKQQVVPCYCTCQRFGHANLLYCFWRDGVVGEDYDEHGSQCPVCMRQAFLAFLWSELGASHAEIIEGMEQKFAPLIKLQDEGKL